jgi:DNA mismatch repair protein MutS
MGAALNRRVMSTIQKKWVFPEMLEGDFRFEIQEGRHPLVEKLLGAKKDFVPQSLSLGGAPHAKRFLLLTGPNMAGKSTLMRLVGLHLILAQVGFPVPAAAMKLSPAQAFFSRMGAHDRILEGESTFMVEMSETAKILKNADENSFVIIDELGRGTSTQDGLALASAVVDALHDQVKCLTLFATHFHELSVKGIELTRIQNASMAIAEWKGDLVFLRQLEFKPAESSYGLFVAKLAGVPLSVIKKAEAELQNGPRAVEPDLFSMMAPVPSPEVHNEELKKLKDLRSEIQSVDLDLLSPRDAWLKLEALKKQISAKEICEDL